MKFAIWNLEYCVEEKILPLKKARGSTSCSKQREGLKERTTFGSIICEFLHFCVASCNVNVIFVGFSLISLESLGFVQWRNSTVHCVNELCYILIISIFIFLTFIHFTNKIILKQSLAQKFKLIFKFSLIKRQINIPVWTHMGHEAWRKGGKNCIRC